MLTAAPRVHGAVHGAYAWITWIRQAVACRDACRVLPQTMCRGCTGGPGMLPCKALWKQPMPCRGFVTSVRDDLCATVCICMAACTHGAWCSRQPPCSEAAVVQCLCADHAHASTQCPCACNLHDASTTSCLTLPALASTAMLHAAAAAAAPRLHRAFGTHRLLRAASSLAAACTRIVCEPLASTLASVSAASIVQQAVQCLLQKKTVNMGRETMILPVQSQKSPFPLKWRQFRNLLPQEKR